MCTRVLDISKNKHNTELQQTNLGTKDDSVPGAVFPLIMHKIDFIIPIVLVWKKHTKCIGQMPG